MVLCAAPPSEVRLILPQPSAGEPAEAARVRRALTEGGDAIAAAKAVRDPRQQRLWLAAAYLFAAEPVPAVRVLRSAAVDTAAAWKVLGFAYAELNQWILFRMAMEQAASLEPADDIPCYLLGRYWDAQIEDLAQAETAFRKALDRNPRRALTLYQLGFVLERRQELAPAEAQYRKALAVSPDYAPALLGLARLRQAAGYAAEALQLAQQALRGAPDHPEIVRLMAKLLQERPAEALPHWRRLTALAPHDASSWYGLLRTLTALGDAAGADAARRQFQLVRETYGNH